MTSDKRHKPEITQNSDGSWNYRCLGCNDKKSNLKSKATGSIAFTSHIRSVQHKVR